MSIWLRWVFMPHYIGPSLRSFCLLKVAHLFDCVSLTVLLGLLGDLGSALSVISLSIFFSLLSLLPSSQLGHIVQLALRELPLLFLISSHILFPPFTDWFACLFPFSPIFLDSLFSLFLSLLSPSSPLLWSQLGHIAQLALRPSVPFCSFSPSLPFRLFSSSLPLLPLPFITRPFLPLLYFPASLWSPACGILLSSLHSSALSPSLFPFGSAWAYCPVHP